MTFNGLSLIFLTKRYHLFVFDFTENFQYFRNCYQRTLSASNQAFDGMLPLSFVIGASGHVTRAGIGRNAESEALPVEVKECVLDVLRGIKFPEPLGGGTVEVNQPMNFYRK